MKDTTRTAIAAILAADDTVPPQAAADALLSPENFIGSKPDALIYRVMKEYPALIHPLRVDPSAAAMAV